MKAKRILLILTIVFLCIHTAIATPHIYTSSQLRKMADARYYSEDFPEALNLYIKAMEAADKEGNETNFIACTGYVGNIYDTFGDNNSSMFYYLKGYNAAKHIANRHLQACFLTNIVTCYTRMGNIKEAKRYYAFITKIPDKDKNLNNKYYSIYVKARILAAEHLYVKAIAEHRKAMSFAVQNGMSKVYLLFQLSEIGNLYVRMCKADDAVAVGDTCMAMAKSINNKELVVNAYKMLADAYSQVQKMDSARHYRELYFDLNDSVYNIKKFYKARYKLSEYENREHEHQVSQLNERISYQTYVIITVALFLLLVMLFFYVVYRKNLHLAQTQRLLIRRNDDLEARESQNRILLKQYLKQLHINESKPSGVASNDCHDGNGDGWETEQKSRLQISDKDMQHDDNADKQLLSKINDVMDNVGIISNPDFCLQMLADMVGSNTTYVSRVINNSFQKNFKTLLNERRIREACHKLQNPESYSGYTIQVVYEAVGYRNASSFIRAFKKVYNMTPSEYINLSTTIDKEA